MTNIVIYFIIAFINVFLHVTKTIFVIKSGKLRASLLNTVCYTFSAIVIKFIAEVDLYVAIIVQASTNFLGCYIAMFICDKFVNNQNFEI